MAKTGLDHRALPRRTSNSPIAVIRRERGITQQKLADMLGTNQKQITRWETNKPAPNEEQLKRIADALNVSIEAIRPVYPSECVTKYQIRIRTDLRGDEPFWPDDPLIDTREEAHSKLIEARTILTTKLNIRNERLVFIQSYLCHEGKILERGQMFFDMT